MITAQEAAEIGLINKVVDLNPSDQLPPALQKDDDASKRKERSIEVARLLNRKLIDRVHGFIKGNYKEWIYRSQN